MRVWVRGVDEDVGEGVGGEDVGEGVGQGAVRQRPAEAGGGGHVHVRWMLDTMDESGAFEGVARDWNAHVGVFGDLVGKR